ncbi:MULTISPECIES: thioredoxin family protein [Xanthobacter]|uniref:thioredoxin family protein n=1 Tax=Xanthobacter TaxID=279 RepID=UPI000497FB02|nr:MULTISPECIES: thioredoxin family protein [Xanthobacter]MCL8384346.1 thioredoxin family protein [Xanthobacter aminoxidans]
MFTRRFTLAFAIALPLAAAAFAGASALAGTEHGATTHAATEHAAYTPAAFADAQKAGKPILVEIHASWCPVCAAQAPILGELLATPKFKDVVVFRVDFDSQKDAVKAFGARSQSTLIVYKGKTEEGRSVGDTAKPSIEALLAKGV